MGRIKSAWEIALERTEEIQADPDKIRNDNLIKEGRQIAGSFLTNSDKTLEDVQQRLDSYSQEQQQVVRTGMGMTILFNLSLPTDEAFKDSMARLQALSHIVNPATDEMLGQLAGFFDQYLQTEDHMVERMKQQFQPMLEQKQAQMRKQYGPDYILRPEQDPEFMKLLQQNLQQLAAQYQQVLDQAKDQMRDMFGIVQ